MSNIIPQSVKCFHRGDGIWRAGSGGGKTGLIIGICWGRCTLIDYMWAWAGMGFGNILNYKRDRVSAQLLTEPGVAEQSPAVDDGEDLHFVAVDLVDDPVFLDKNLAVVLKAELRYDASSTRQKFQSTSRSEDPADHRGGVARGMVTDTLQLAAELSLIIRTPFIWRSILRDVSGDVIQVIADLGRPRYDKVHRAISCSIVAWGMPPSETRRCWPCFIFSSTYR